MNQQFQTVYKRFKQLANIGTVAAVALLISLLYPSNIKFKYQINRGQMWQHEDLVAPFDFAIMKSQKELEEDKLLIMKDFWPYYDLNDDLATAKIRDFEAALETWKNGSPPQLTDPQFQRLRRAGREMLVNIYDTGIVEASPDHAGADQKFVINVVEGNTIFKRTLSGFYRPEQAAQALEEMAKKSTIPVPDPVLNLLKSALVPNINFDEARTKVMLDEALNKVSKSRGMVSQGELIIKKGNLVTDEVFDKLVSFRTKFEGDISSQKSGVIVYFGYLLLTVLIIGAFIMYVYSYRQEVLSNWNYLAFVMFWLVAFSYLTFLVERTSVLSVYVIPYCVVPIVVRHFFTYRLAFFTHVVVVLIAGFLTSEGYQFLFTQIVAGVVAVLAIADARDWSRFFKSMVAILLAYSLSQIGLSLIQEGNFEGIDVESLGWLVFNGLLTLVAFPLIPLSERAFGFTSSISLVELSDMSRPLLRELALKAPGTFQHSLQVGNLAEAAANEIGADPLTVRVGALYHDVGKMVAPEYFIENQSGVNPHEKLDRLESASIIIKHVTDGEKMAKKAHLPAVITRFISTHHGTTKTDFFYKTYALENPDAPVGEAAFTYPGPLPVSKEEAILMLADSTEATSRCLVAPTGQEIDKLVNKIFKNKIEQGQLNDSKLTYGDLEKCRATFQKMLRSIHHVRIEYPE